MKMTDGLFHAVFDEVAKEYPEIENEFWIVDIGAAKLSATPEAFDVVVMPNLYGDILSDVAAQIAGSVGLAGSANIGDHLAMFEAIHGSAPRHAGQNRANPSGLLLGGVMMLVHLGQAETATRLHNAWLRTIEDGIHTADIFKEGTSVERVGTREFAQAVVARLGQEPQQFKPAAYQAGAAQGPITIRPTVSARKELVGVDVFVDWQDRDATKLAASAATARRQRPATEHADEPWRAHLAGRLSRNLSHRPHPLPLPRHGRRHRSTNRSPPCSVGLRERG